MKGPANTLTVPVSLNATAPPPITLVASPASLQFTTQLGQPASPSQIINVPPSYDPFTVGVQTTNGGSWLSALLRNAPGVPAAVVSVDPSGLAVGIYTGSVTLTSSVASVPTQVPVTLTIWTGTPPPVTVDVSSVSLTTRHGTATSQTVHVSTGGLPLPFSASAQADDSGHWLTAAAVLTDAADPSTPPATPDTVVVGVDATSLSPGFYTGTVTITAPAGSSNFVTIPVTFKVTPAPQPLPQAGTVPLATTILNAASQGQGSLSPGEIITIFGQNIGPSNPAGFALCPDGKVATSLGGVQLLFDGIPAPLLYASATQLNAIVPYSANNPANVSIQFNGASIPLGGYSVTGSAPGLFTFASNGEGPAAVLNQDNSPNSISNPAARGTIIQIFATGEGITSPPGITGELTASGTKTPALPVLVTIGGIAAPIAYAGSAPDAVAGLFQTNVIVPDGVPTGSSVPIVLTIGHASSQSNATIAVQ